jgi:DnaJ domain
MLVRMRYCSCGNVAVEGGAECTRCRSLRALGLQVGASDSQIRSAYHVLVKVWHPDRFQHDPALKTQAEEKLKSINTAFQYLTSAAAKQEQRQRSQGPRDSSGAAPESSGDAETAVPTSQSNPKSVGSFAHDVLLKALSLPLIVRRCAFIAALALIGWILFMPIDKFLTSEPLTAGPYQQYKSEVWRGLAGIGVAIQDSAGRAAHNTVPSQSPPVASDASQQEPSQPTALKTASKKPEYPVESGSIGALPYVTAGLSKYEVTSIQGPPTSASENELIYGQSELYFKNDKLVGWRIDPESPIRVKLWPDVPVDPDRDTFWVGSSKSEVIAIQGTPTLWSENTFGYGGSEVYFRKGRVVNWKNDPATVQLRAAQR